MKTSPWVQHLAVCSWSLQPETPQQLIEHLLALGILRVQIALDPIRTRPAAWRAFPELCARHGIEMVSGMFDTVGEDYSTIESIRLAACRA